MYHLTDVPSFVSGDYVVIFDPHATYVPQASVQHPGIRIKFTSAGSHLLDQFPDQFTPYLHFGCDMKSRFSGTLFRFPLRSQVAARNSSIKSRPTSVSDIDELLKSLQRDATQVMLFLKNM